MNCCAGISSNATNFMFFYNLLHFQLEFSALGKLVVYLYKERIITGCCFYMARTIHVALQKRVKMNTNVQLALRVLGRSLQTRKIQSYTKNSGIRSSREKPLRAVDTIVIKSQSSVSWTVCPRKMVRVNINAGKMVWCRGFGDPHISDQGHSIL